MQIFTLNCIGIIDFFKCSTFAFENMLKAYLCNSLSFRQLNRYLNSRCFSIKAPRISFSIALSKNTNNSVYLEYCLVTRLGCFGF